MFDVGMIVFVFEISDTKLKTRWTKIGTQEMVTISHFNIHATHSITHINIHLCISFNCIKDSLF